MPYDDNRRFFRPDFQAQLQQGELPQWQDIGADRQGQQMEQNAGSFTDMLKKRMSGTKPMAAGGSAADSGMSQGLSGGMPATRPRTVGGGEGGGGPQSL